MRSRSLDEGRPQRSGCRDWQNRAWSWIGIWSIPVSPLLRRDDLRPHASCNRTWSAPANRYPAIHETLVDPFGCYPGKKGLRRPVRYEGSGRGRDRSPDLTLAIPLYWGHEGAFCGRGQVRSTVALDEDAPEDLKTHLGETRSRGTIGRTANWFEILTQTRKGSTM